MRTVIQCTLCRSGSINILRKLEKEVMEDGSERGYSTILIPSAEAPVYVVAQYNDCDEMVDTFSNRDEGEIVISKEEWEERVNEFIEAVRKLL